MDALWTGPFRRPSIQRFGGELACASIWMLTGLALQALVSSAGLSKYVPSALLFSVPFIISRNWRLTHITLPVRIMEWKMGRFSLKRIPMYVVAHTFGYLFGLVLFSLVTDSLVTLPYVGLLSKHLSLKHALNISQGMGITGEEVCAASTGIPIDSLGGCSQGTKAEEGNPWGSIPGVAADVVATSMYGLAMIVVPEVLIVNKMSVARTVPLLCAAIALVYSLFVARLQSFYGSSLLNPVAYGVINYGKWLNTATVAGSSFQESITLVVGGAEPFVDFRQSNLLIATLLLGSLKYIFSPRVIGHFGGSIIGSILTGILCNMWFPDDSATWKPWRRA